MQRLCVLALFVLLLGACQARTLDRSRTPVSAPPAEPTVAAATDTLAAERDSLMNAVLERIAGSQDEPADSVFENVQLLGRVPAGRFLRIMNMGFGRSLGVSCSHCHVVGEWDKDDKPEKQIAREMWQMVGAINTEYLARIPNLESERPAVNCTTCHRGNVKPALNLSSP